MQRVRRPNKRETKINLILKQTRPNMYMSCYTKFNATSYELQTCGNKEKCDTAHKREEIASTFLSRQQNNCIHQGLLSLTQSTQQHAEASDHGCPVQIHCRILPRASDSNPNVRSGTSGEVESFHLDHGWSREKYIHHWRYRVNMAFGQKEQPKFSLLHK